MAATSNTPQNKYLDICLGPPLDSQYLIKGGIADYIDGTWQWLFEEFDLWVNDSTSALGASGNENSKVFILVAGTGFGKTTITAKLVQDWADVVVAHHFFCHDISTKNDPREMLFSVASQLSTKVAVYKSELEKSRKTKIQIRMQ